MGTADQPPAGWYPDSGGGTWRYWDGQQWTQHLAPLQSEAASDAVQLSGDARRARIALAIGVPLQTLSVVGQAHQVRASREAITRTREQFEDLHRQLEQPGSGTTLRSTSQTTPLVPLGSVSGLPSIVIGIVFLIWFHRSVTIAAQLGRPARRTPGWAVGGWLIPIGNFFLPYQSARDVFRPGDPARAGVKRWWALYLTAALAAQPFAALAGIRDEHQVPTLVAVGAFAFVLWLWAYLAARDFVDSATASLTYELTP